MLPKLSIRQVLTLLFPFSLLLSAYRVAPGEIRGVIFEDYNANGIRDIGEPGLGGVTVNAYADGDNVASPSYSIMSANDGTYSITGLAGGEELRLEFILPTAKDYLAQGAAGNTSVVFAAEGDENVNVGFNNPNNYSIADPVMASPCYVFGDHTDGTGGKRDVLVGWKYSWGGVPTVVENEDRYPFPAIHYAQNEQMGTTWGTAWDRTSNTIYLSAYQKKHTDFGPSGPGAIYSMLIDPMSGIPQSLPGLFADVATFSGISVCGSHGNDLNPGSDPATADLAGKCSLGDLDISDDNTKLYVVNLGDRKVIEIDIATGNMTNNWQFPTTLSGSTCFTCGDTNDVRPFGLKFRNGLLYVGAMCTGENTMNNNDVASFIYTLDPSLGAGAAFNEFYCFNWGADLPDNGDDNYWKSGTYQENTGETRNYIFSDIEFYGNDLIMAFRDRKGDMTGSNVPGVSVEDQTRGEIITAFFDTTAGNHVLESNAQAGPDRPGSNPTYGYPEDGEFYWGDGWNDFNTASAPPHGDQSFGGLAQINAQDLVMTTLTPRQAMGTNQTGSGGLIWLSNTTGSPTKSYTLYRGGPSSDPGDLFAKANGLGDVEGLTTPAPIEIGDYVWVDSDGDGVQDPGEATLNGITVELYKNGNLVNSTTTDANGRYYFTSAENVVFSSGLISDPLDSGSDTENNMAMELDNGGVTAVQDGFRINSNFRSYSGIRFENINIPQGATITSAYIQYTSNDSPETDLSEIRIFGEAIDDAPIFMEIDDNLSTRTLTSASVDWNIPAFNFVNVATTNERTPDISSIIQEIINRSGWSPGNALAILNEFDLNGNDGSRRSDSDPRLVVEFTAASPLAGSNQESILPNMNYEVRLGLNQAQITSNSYSLTSVNSAASGSETSNNAASDIRDNDATEVGVNAVIAFSTGNWGENNHGLDFGFNNASASCTLSAIGKSNETCNDNGTSTNPADDYITFSLNPMGTGTSATYTVTADNGAVVSLSNGSPATAVSYGSATGFRLQTGSADGSTTYTVTVTDDTDGSCQITTTVLQSPCALALYSLGNQVFYDDDNSGAREAGENGVDGIILQLLNADGSVYDSDPLMGGTQVLSVSTANGGYYRFDDLPAGSYIVEILPPAFTSGGILENYSSSDGAGEEANPNADGDENDNGLDNSPSGTIRSGVVSLGGAEPLGESEPGFYTTGSFTGTPASDSESNLTVDFGFYRQRDRPDCCDDEENPCDDEPCHFISNNIYFGNGVTNDSNSNTNAEANADTDDGLLWGENLNLSPGGIINLPVSMYNNTGNNAYFRAWVDWNNDGDFEDVGEQVADEIYLSAVYSGSFAINHSILIPFGSVQNQNLALRMRLSTDDTNTNAPCGNGTCADDGEIEDYLLRVSCSQTLCLPISLSRRD